jgi:aspartyl-tRNA(Asn)/glutamyl-tRNA(Gln) amidotransferase subunit A
MPLTCGSRILEGYRAPYDATPVARLRRLGMIVLGKTNLDEFAMGSSGEHSAFRPVRNPLDPGRVAGGSSSGAAAAVAAGMVPVALGSDTGGSVRQPAAFCGLVGLKPTYGRVSRYGLVAFASSLDHVGPITRSVRDAARLLDAIAGPDTRDSTACDVEPPCAESALGRDVAGTRIGVVAEALEEDLHPAVRAGVERAVDAARARGMEVRTLRLPVFSLALPAYYILCTAEAASNLARYDGVRYGRRARAEGLEALYRETRSAGFGREVKRRILLGTFVLSRGYREAYYRRALRARARVVRAMREAFEEVDLLMTPTTPAPAFALGERMDDPVEMYRSDVFTGIANLAGVPPSRSRPAGGRAFPSGSS